MNCDQCGICCKLFLINLNKEEYESNKFETVFDNLNTSYEEALKIGAIFLKQNKDGSCIYLKDNKCSIHKTRPKVCTEFFCESKEEKFQGMVKEIELKKKLK